jgi:undecaprenyl-diphosphatase
VVVFALAVFDLLGSLATGDNDVTRFDRFVSARCEVWTNQSPRVVDFFRAITSFGDTDFLTLVAWLTVLAIAIRGRIRLALAWMIAAAAVGLLNDLLKQWYDRPRPQFGRVLVGTGNSSFPSGHAMGSAVIYGLLAYWLMRSLPGRVGRALADGLLVLVLAIAASRVVLGAHWPSDVVAGVVAGGAWLAVCIPVLDAVSTAETKRAAGKTIESYSPL